MGILGPVLSGLLSSVSKGVLVKYSDKIVFDFSGGALPSGVTYSGPANMYVPQSNGNYELVTSGPLFSDEALYIPAGFTDYIGNKTFAGAVAGDVQGSGSPPTGSNLTGLDNGGSDTVTIVSTSNSDSEMRGFPSITIHWQRTGSVSVGGFNLAMFTSLASGQVDVAEGDVLTHGCLFKFTNLADITGLVSAYLRINPRNSSNAGLGTNYAQASINTLLQDLIVSYTMPATTDYANANFGVTTSASGDVDVTFKIAAPQLINKLTLPLCIANGSADSAIVVTGGSCTKASGVSLNPKLSVVLDYISQNGEVGQNDLINPSNARNFDISSSNGSTSLHAFTHNSTKHAVIEALAGSVYTSKLENDDVLMGGVTNRVVYVFGEEGIKISLNGGTTATETWEEYIDAGILTNIGYGCSAAGSLPAGIGVKTMTIYPNTEFSAAECQSRSAL